MTERSHKRTVLPWLLLAFLILLGFVESWLFPRSQRPQDHLLATVNGQPITVADFHLFQERHPSVAPDSTEARREILELLIQREALAQQARTAGIEETPEFRAALQSLLIAHHRERDLQQAIAAIEIGESTLREAYEAQKASRFQQPIRQQVAMLWLNSRGQPTLEKAYCLRLEEVREQLSANQIPSAEGFGRFAITTSEHRPTRFAGGKLGWLEDAPYDDPIRNAANDIATGLAPGELSEVEIRPEGVFLVRLQERQEGGALPYDQVRDRLALELKQDARRELEASFNRKALEAVEVERFEERLSDLPSAPVTSSDLAQN